MTPDEIIALSHRETDTRGRKPTKAEIWLATHLHEALKGCSVAQLRSHAILNMLTKAELKPLKLDTKAVDEVGT